MKQVIKKIAPPIIWDILRAFRSSSNTTIVLATKKGNLDATSQDLDLYWDPAMAEVLENWGKDHVWNEIEMFLVGKQGKVLDIACGTGITIQILSRYNGLELYGCDISDFLISKAIEKGISKDRLLVCDATNMSLYADGQFDYSFSIGSLEHFTEEGISKFISEVHRITNKMTFHMMPVSRQDKDEGWMKTMQSFHNNSVQWWLNRFHTSFKNVTVINSGWKDEISLGKWFICIK